MRIGRIFHLGIAIGVAKAVEIEAQDIDTRRAQRVAPRNAIEPVGDGEPRWKAGAVHIEHGTWTAGRGLCRRPPTQKKSQALTCARDPVMLFPGIEPSC